MTDQLAVALISGGAALLVAVLGIAGTIAAQVIATRRGFENSLELFERQAAEAQKARDEATRAENRHRFADQKRNTYSRTLRLADELVVAREAARGAEKYHERSLRTLDRVGDQSDALAKTTEDFANAAKEHRDRARRLTAELAEVVSEVHLLSDSAVRAAADRLQKTALSASHIEESRYVDDRADFLLAARSEFGIEPATSG